MGADDRNNVTAEVVPPRINRGPHPSIIVVARNFMPEQEIQHLIQRNGFTAQMERIQRIQAVNFIQSVRQALDVPAQTYATACILYHRFRLLREEKDYGWQDVAVSSLFLACKIEDTLKKSREILCAVQNLKKNPSADDMTPDDSFFDAPQKIVHGLERLLLEQNSFDFRSRKPLGMILKIGKKFGLDSQILERNCWAAGLDMYRTYAPLKASTYAMALACLEIGFLLAEKDWKELTADQNVEQFHIERVEVMEIMQDLCDLWVSHHKETCVGDAVPLDDIITVRIKLNSEMQASSLPRYIGWQEPAAPSATTSPAQTSPSSTKDTPNTPISPADTRNKTVRYMLEPDRAANEKSLVSKFFVDEYEQYEEEVVIEEPPSQPALPTNNHSHRGHSSSRPYAFSHGSRNYQSHDHFSHRGGRSEQNGRHAPRRLSDDRCSKGYRLQDESLKEGSVNRSWKPPVRKSMCDNPPSPPPPFYSRPVSRRNSGIEGWDYPPPPPGRPYSPPPPPPPPPPPHMMDYADERRPYRSGSFSSYDRDGSFYPESPRLGSYTVDRSRSLVYRGRARGEKLRRARGRREDY